MLRFQQKSIKDMSMETIELLKYDTLRTLYKERENSHKTLDVGNRSVILAPSRTS